MSKEFGHKSVLLEEVIFLLSPNNGESLLDVTLGLGGHSEAVLGLIGASGSLIGIDADIDNIAIAKERLDHLPGTKEYKHTNFVELPNLGIPKVDMIFADLGMSSLHVDDPDRGFTYHHDVALDLRYDRTSGTTAYELLRRSSEEDIANIFYRYGEIKQSRRLAAEVKRHLPETTGELQSLVDESFGYKGKELLPQVFQSLRIAVNRELEALSVLLEYGPPLLKPGGRMVIISFHSLEDRLVKQAFKKFSAPEIDDRTGQVAKESEWELLTKKPIVPSEEECTSNPRSRSAKMRGIQRKIVVH